MENTIKKLGKDLTNLELENISDAEVREFKVPPVKREDILDRLFFLLKRNDEIVAFAALMKVHPVRYQSQEFTVHGVVNVIANRKGEGFGKRIVTELREYLQENDYMGLGFCMPRHAEFYKKCGFTIDPDIAQRLVYQQGDKRITNSDGQVNFYQDNSQHILQEIFSSSHNIYIPTDKLW